MHSRPSEILALALLLAIAPALYSRAQTQSPEGKLDIAPASDRFPASWYPPEQDGQYVAPDVGAPYSATLSATAHAIDPATGTVTSADEKTLHMRDSAGRERFDSAGSEPDSHGGTQSVHHIQVKDPVSHCHFYWTESSSPLGQPSATVGCNSRTLHYVSGPSWASEMVTEVKESEIAPGIMDKAEPLAKRNFDEFEAIGVRHTTTQTDATTGKTIRGVSELWFCPELNIIVEMKSASDTASGNPSDEHLDLAVSRIRRGEPDAKLFYPPAGYAIKPEH